jgi:hypothetical protein
MANPSWIPSLISAASGLLGVCVGGLITFFGQRYFQRADRAEKRGALAASLGAEIDAYLHLMKVRDHETHARTRIQRLRAGQHDSMRGWGIDPTAKPLSEFPVFWASISEIGVLGTICSDLSRFYALTSGVQSTAIAAERGAYDNLSLKERADLIEGELAVFVEATNLGRSLVPRLNGVSTGRS